VQDPESSILDVSDNSNLSPDKKPQKVPIHSLQECGRVTTNMAEDPKQAMLALGTDNGTIKIISLKGYE